MRRSIKYAKSVIVGGGPVGSSLARIKAQGGERVVLIHNPLDLGSHNDISRLVRPALDADATQLALSYKALEGLLNLNAYLIGRQGFITKKPGVLFLASPGTLLARRLAETESFEKKLRKLNFSELSQLFPDLPFANFDELQIWFHPEGYVVDPLALVRLNHQIAKEAGCEIIEGRAELDFSNPYYQVSIQGQEIKTRELYLLAGAQNKALAANLQIPSFDNTYLSAISTLRFRLNSQKTMPITVGELTLPEFPGLLDFSTMPEPKGIVKTRLSGFGESERVEKVENKNTLEAEPAKANAIKLFSQIFPFLFDPHDFSRCVTYRNKDPNLHGLSFLQARSPASVLTTTLGCYGVGVRNSDLLARSMQFSASSNRRTSGIHQDLICLAVTDYVKKMLPGHEQFLEKSQLSRLIGRTPVKKLSGNLYLKMEGENLTGSIKDRVALHVLLKKIENGEIKEGHTLVTATSGSYGVSLVAIKKFIEDHLNFHFKLVFFTPKNYREKAGIKNLRQLQLAEIDYMGSDSEKITSQDALLYVDGDFALAMRLAKELGASEGYLFLDQQFDEMHVQAHKSTALELAEQLPEVTDIVVTAGTGATATGFSRYFPRAVTLHSRPAKSGEIVGLSDPRKYNNYFKAERYTGYQGELLSLEAARKMRCTLFHTHHIEVSDSTGAALSIANEIQEKNEEAVIAVISASK